MHKQLQPIFEDVAIEKSNEISVDKLLSKALKYWPLFTICLASAVTIAFIYLRYTTPVYMVNAKLLVKDDRKGGMAEGQVFQDMGIKSGIGTVDNEIEIFKSRILMRKVMDQLDLNVRYFIPGRFKTEELYNAYYKCIPLFDDSLITSDYAFTIKNELDKLIINEGGKLTTAKLGDTVQLVPGKVLIVNNNNTSQQPVLDKEVTCIISPQQGIINSYINALEVAAINKQVSIVKLSIADAIPQRGEDILNTLMKVYMTANVDDKNRVAESTMEFIDERLRIVSSELSGIEGDIQIFKQNNNLTNVDEQSKVLLDYSSSNEKQLMQQEIQLTIVKSLEEFLKSSQNIDKTVPSTFFVQDLSLTAMVNNYNNLQSQKQRLLMTNTETSPYVNNINLQLRSVRADMKDNLSSLADGLKVSINEMKRRMGLLDVEIKKVPAQEKAFLEYSRQQNIKQELYLFLLKKREETAISKASASPNARIIDVAESDTKPFSPSTAKVVLSALVLGLLIPAARVTGKELLNIRVTDKEVVSDLTNITILGEIGHNTKPETIVVKKDSRSQISEQFRQLRTNLQFLLSGETEKTILVTSSMSGEGKSFISINLATTLALSDKRVVLLELDLRKPKISSSLGIDNSTGFSNYAIGSGTISDIIKPSGILSNLFVIPSGVIPPNPAEIVMLPKVQELFNALQQQFDVIIIDTAPVGLVTDAQLLGRYADVTMYVVRQGYTYKQQLKNANQLFIANKLPRMNIVMNDVDNKYGGYGYGQYGNGYFEEDRKGPVKEMLKRFKKTF